MSETRAGSAAEPDAEGALLGFHVYGHFERQSGLRVSALNTIAQLERRGERLTLHSVARREVGVDPASSEGRVNLFHINPDDFLLFQAWPHEDPRFEQRLNVLVPFWELSRIPDFWMPVLGSMDMVLAPTGFVAEAVAASLPDTVLGRLPQTVEVPEGVRRDRDRFHLPEDAFAVGTGFGAEASLERKNPYAVIAAFQKAFPDDPGVRLVVRASPGQFDKAQRVRDSLRSHSGDDSRVLIPEEPWDYADVLSMYASLDLYVSLHRAEGLGLGLMESMAVGTPVMATAWSGNMDFMTPENSILVDYDLVPVAVADSSPYSRGSVGAAAEWAEPRVDDAAAKMRMLRDDPGLRERLSGRARSDMASRRALVDAAGFLDLVRAEALRDLESDAAHLAKAKVLRKIERQQRLKLPYYESRRLAGRTLRALKLR